jgi:hypothetical protein
MRFDRAVSFANAMDWPLNISITLTWTALYSAGEHNEGHCLGRDEWEREKYVRDELARLCRSEGVPFAALWGRDVGATLGSHVHLFMYWPSLKPDRLILVLERLSGSTAASTLRPCDPDVVARPVCGGWQINKNIRANDQASARDLAVDIATQDAKHPAPPSITGKAFGISEALGTAAQERARPMLEARETQYGWLPPGLGPTVLSDPHIAAARVLVFLPINFGKICEEPLWAELEADGDGTTAARARRKAIGPSMPDG